MLLDYHLRCHKLIVEALFLEAQQHGQKRVSKWTEKPLSSSGRNNGLQAHEINKWALRSKWA